MDTPDGSRHSGEGPSLQEVSRDAIGLLLSTIDDPTGAEDWALRLNAQDCADTLVGVIGVVSFLIKRSDEIAAEDGYHHPSLRVMLIAFRDGVLPTLGDIGEEDA